MDGLMAAAAAVPTSGATGGGAAEDFAVVLNATQTATPTGTAAAANDDDGPPPESAASGLDIDIDTDTDIELGALLGVARPESEDEAETEIPRGSVIGDGSTEADPESLSQPEVGSVLDLTATTAEPAVGIAGTASVDTTAAAAPDGDEVAPLLGPVVDPGSLAETNPDGPAPAPLPNPPSAPATDPQAAARPAPETAVRQTAPAPSPTIADTASADISHPATPPAPVSVERVVAGAGVAPAPVAPAPASPSSVADMGVSDAPVVPETTSGIPDPVAPQPQIAETTGSRVDAPAAADVAVAAAPTNAPVRSSGAEAAAPPPSTPPDAPAESTPAQQVAQALRDVRRLADGSHRLSLQLHPEELGAVQLEVAIREGQLHVRAVAETEVARAAIEQSIPELRSELRDAGVRTGSLEVGPDTSGRQPADANEADRGAATDAADSSPDPSTEATVSITGAVDIRL